MTQLVPAMPPGPVAVDAASETVDVADLARSIRIRWRSCLGWMAFGLLAAAGTVCFAPRRFTSQGSLLLRSAADQSSSLLSRIGLPTELSPSALGGALKSPIETEVQLLESRDVLGAVVDSLGLQARVLGRAGVPSRALLRPATYPGAFQRETYAFERLPDGRYRVSGHDTAIVAVVGVPTRLPVVGAVTIEPNATLPQFRIKFEDREDAIARLSSLVRIDKQGGEVASVAYGGPDSLTAAEVPNAIVAVYLARRRTVDRGVNQRRYEFLSAQADSVAARLRGAEDALRRVEEASGVLDPETAGRIGAEAERTLREQAGAIAVERHALGQLLTQAADGTISPRQLAAYPSFLKSEAINALLSQIATLETERTRALEMRTERDPGVIAITASITNLEQQLVPLGRAYQTALDRQAEEVGRQLGVVDARLAQLPGQAESNLQRQRDVKQLSGTSVALQTQIVDARLAAIGEGGQIRQIDVAQPPKRPSFPRPIPIFLIGGLGGLFIGLCWALLRGALDSRMLTPRDVERAFGVRPHVLRRGHPLLLGAGARAGSVVVLAVSAADDALRGGASTVAVVEAVAGEAAQRGQEAVVVDSATLGTASALRSAVVAMERDHPLVVVAGQTIDEPSTVSLLEPPRSALLAVASGARRDAMEETLDALARLGVPCLAVVFVPGSERAAVRAPATAARSLAADRRRAAGLTISASPHAPGDGD